MPGYLATIDSEGYPHVTPVWFHWDGSLIRATSLVDKPHVRLRRNPRAGFVVDLEDAEVDGGERLSRSGDLAT